MNSVFELLIKVWTGSRDLKVCVFDLVILFLASFFSHTFEQYSISTDRSVRTREGEENPALNSRLL